MEPRAPTVPASACRLRPGSTSVPSALSWNVVRGLRWMLDYSQVQFDGGAAAGGNRADEKVLFTRFQVSF